MIIALIGATGKVGKEIAKIALKRKHTVIPIDKDTQENQIEKIVCDIVIDFSNPQAIYTAKTICLNNDAPLICGTTGHNDMQKKELNVLSQKVTVVHKVNFTQSIDAFITCAKNAIKALPDFKVSISECHRKNKLDSPSGTAIYIKQQLQSYCNNDINITSIRKGDTVGIHTVTLTNGKESISLQHKVTSRTAFAQGCVLCAEQVYQNKQ